MNILLILLVVLLAVAVFAGLNHLARKRDARIRASRPARPMVGEWTEADFR